MYYARNATKYALMLSNPTVIENLLGDTQKTLIYIFILFQTILYIDYTRLLGLYQVNYFLLFIQNKLLCIFVDYVSLFY